VCYGVVSRISFLCVTSLREFGKRNLARGKLCEPVDSADISMASLWSRKETVLFGNKVEAGLFQKRQDSLPT